MYMFIFDSTANNTETFRSKKKYSHGFDIPSSGVSDYSMLFLVTIRFISVDSAFRICHTQADRFPRTWYPGGAGHSD